MESASFVFFEHVIVLTFFLVLGLVFFKSAKERGWTNLPQDGVLKSELSEKKRLYGKFAFQAFFLFLFIQMVVVPFVYTLWIYGEYGSFDVPSLLSPVLQGWVHVGSVVLTAGILIGFYASLDKVDRKIIWGSSKKGVWQNVLDFLVGGMTWVCAYPWIIVIDQIFAIFFSYFYSGPLVDQIAVRHLREMEHSPLFVCTIIAIITLIPFIEELLFRGFLQSWLKAILGYKRAIILTSVVFASFHFSSSQGIENLEFISSLFVLSCYLGFIKEKRHSLYASIGLHATFNCASVLMLLLT